MQSGRRREPLSLVSEQTSKLLAEDQNDESESDVRNTAAVGKQSRPPMKCYFCEGTISREIARSGEMEVIWVGRKENTSSSQR